MNTLTTCRQEEKKEEEKEVVAAQRIADYLSSATNVVVSDS